MKLSVLIPVYNEEKTLPVIIPKVLNQRVPGVDQFEIVVVDDASQDRSKEIIQQLIQKYPEIQPVYQSVNQGKGAAIRKAIEAASGDIAIIQDADLEYDPSDYPAMLTPIIEDRADVVYGSRFMVSGERRVCKVTTCESRRSSSTESFRTAAYSFSICSLRTMS